MIRYREILARIVLPDAVRQDADLAAEYLIDELLENNEIAIPQEKLKEEIARLSAMRNRQLQYDMILSGDLSRFQPDYLAVCRGEVREEAEKQLKAELILHHIAETEQITVTHEELESEAKKISQRDHIPFEMVKSFLGEDFDLLRDDLLMQKTLRWICDYAANKGQI